LIFGLESTDRQVVTSSGQSSCLLRQEANVGHDVLHFSVGELPSPGMHGAEDNAVLDGSQQLIIGLQERLKSLKIGRRDFQ
jgi:hypothetical protein